MSLDIKQREDEWNIHVSERWIFRSQDDLLKVMRYLSEKNIPFSVSYGIGIFISMNNVTLSFVSFDIMTSILLELLKLKKAFGDVVKVEREAHGGQL
jgi:hypothetical protein